jgi:hypothetical protein
MKFSQMFDLYRYLEWSDHTDGKPIYRVGFDHSLCTSLIIVTEGLARDQRSRRRIEAALISPEAPYLHRRPPADDLLSTLCPQSRADQPPRTPLSPSDP